MNRQLIGKIPDTGKERGQKEKRASEDELAGQLITDAMNVNLGKLREMVKDRQAWSPVVPRVTKSHTQLGN